MKLIYAKTTDINLDSFLKFCYDKLSHSYRENLSEFNRIWKFTLKSKYINDFENSEYVILNNKGEYIGRLDAFKEDVKKGIYIWDIEDIELIYPYEEEYFVFDEYENFIENKKYFINKIGMNKEGSWIYMEIENKDTHYRQFIINLKSFTNINKYIRQEKIKKLLDI